MDDEQQSADEHADEQPTQDSGPVEVDSHADARLSRALLQRASLAFGRGLTTAAVVVAAAAGAAAIAVLAGVLTLFGWGLAVVVALVAAAASAAVRRRPANAWLIVPALALAVPAVAVGISDVRVLPQRGPVVEVPTSVAQIPDDGYRAGFGDLLVDLRELDIDPGDDVVIRAGSDLRRTVVALPQDQCFALDVRWKTGDLRLPRFLERPTVTGFRPGSRLESWGQQSPGMRKRHALTSGRIALFGRAYDQDHGRWVAPARESGVAKVTLELESEGGSFVVRDFPDDASPLNDPGWPINQVPPGYPVSAMAARRSVAAQIRDLPQAAPARAATPTSAPSAATPVPPRASATTKPKPATRPRRGTTPATAVPTQPTAPTKAATPATAVPTQPSAKKARKTNTATTPTPVPAPRGSAARTPTKPRSATLALRPLALTPSGRPVVLYPRDGRLRAVLDAQGRVVARVTARNLREWHAATRELQKFGRDWAERVAGTCAPRGTLR